MATLSLVFDSPSEARGALDAIKAHGVDDSRISYLTPGDKPDDHRVSTGKGAGATVGGVLGMGAATFLIPGLGPIAGVGLLAGALAGAGLGAVAGQAVDHAGVDKKDLYFYEDALRRGKTVILVDTRDADEETQIRNLLEHGGGRSLQSLRRDWWHDLRDSEREHMRSRGAVGEWNEDDYRSGFEAALHPAVRGQDYDQAAAYIESCYPEPCKTEVFRVGFDRGRQYLHGRNSGQVH